MGERKFVFEEKYDKEEYCNQITESELKRRLALIAPQDLTYHDGANAVTDEDIDILLHGEGKEGENE